MTATISRLYDDYADAERAVTRLEAAGVSHSDISIMSNNADGWYSPSQGTQAKTNSDRNGNGVNDRAEGASMGAGVGAVMGGAAGLLAGLGVLAIPGLGPIVAAGYLAAAGAGLVGGGAVGGILGALTKAGVSDTDAHVYAEGVRRGGSLVTARVNDADRARLDAILNDSSVDIAARREAYRKNGWDGFTDDIDPYTADQVRRERETFRSRGI